MNLAPNRRRRSGFTMAEMIVTSFLLSLLTVIFAATWGAFAQPAVDVVARARIVHEASLACDALQRDLCGQLSNPEGRIGALTDLPFVARQQPGGNQLELCFDGGSPPNGAADWAAPDAVIRYSLQSGKLVRTDVNAGSSIAIARYATGFSTNDLGGGRVQIEMTFAFRGFTKTFTLVAIDPL